MIDSKYYVTVTAICRRLFTIPYPHCVGFPFIIRSSSSSIEKLKELHPQDNLKAADSRLYRHKLYYFGLYYIICFPVKENLWIMRWVSVLDVLVFKATHRPFKRAYRGLHWPKTHCCTSAGQEYRPAKTPLA